jgi:hypothetical protein
MGSEQFKPAGPSDVVEIRIRPRKRVVTGLASHRELELTMRDIILRLVARDARDLEWTEGPVCVGSMTTRAAYLFVRTVKRKPRLVVDLGGANILERNRIVALRTLSRKGPLVDVIVAGSALRQVCLGAVETKSTMTVLAVRCQMSACEGKRSLPTVIEIQAVAEWHPRIRPVASRAIESCVQLSMWIDIRLLPERRSCPDGKHKQYGGRKSAHGAVE